MSFNHEFFITHKLLIDQTSVLDIWRKQVKINVSETKNDIDLLEG